ncbi:hypothetical protein [Nitratireductor sp. XY-223]|uniref:hypothetical protein n=1 Tax=Nitratireductor sp. XY-223 TaxID=2561926 RepID=UPI00145BCD1B|nr:hypothetical protein [Nitratireductor sp. XY-223]
MSLLAADDNVLKGAFDIGDEIVDAEAAVAAGDVFDSEKDHKQAGLERRPDTG